MTCISAVMMNLQKAAGTEPNQLVKTKNSPIWSGQKFDVWKKEIEKWSANNKGSEEDKYIDLFESLKKNETIKEYVHKSMIEKRGDERTVRNIMEILSEKYYITTGEKILLLMKKISEFKIDDDIETLIDKFEDIITEAEKVDLAKNLNYALSIQFVDRLEKGNKIDSGEKLRLKDVIENSNGKPKLGNTPQFLKKELKRMKVENGREEVFTNNRL